MENGAEIPKLTLSSDVLGPKEQIPFVDKVVAATNFLYKNYHAFPMDQQGIIIF